jgi:diguanylate cyclase (GGDEF)-like protein/PAS domain S-box-containing protein
MQSVFLIPILLLVLFVSGFVGAISYWNGQNAINKVASQLRSEITARIQDQVHQFLEIPHQINQTTAFLMRKFSLDTHTTMDLEEFFWNQVQIYPNVTSIYFGSRDGGIAGSGRETTGGFLYTYHTEDLLPGTFEKYSADEFAFHQVLLTSVPGFDVRKRPWYLDAIIKAEPTWSGIYSPITGQDMAIAATLPVYDDEDNLLGVASVDIFLAKVEQFLKELQIDFSGQSFIIERSGLLVATSVGEPLLKDPEGGGSSRRLSVLESENPITRQAADALIQHFGDFYAVSGEYQLEFKSGGQRQFLQVLPLQDPHGIDWLIVVVIPEAVFMEQIQQNNRVTIALIFLSIVVVIIFIVFIVRRMTNPILKFHEAAQSISAGNWEHAIPVDSSITEIRELGQSFSEMSQKLQLSMSNLNTEIEERMAVEETLRESEERYRTLMENVPAAVFRSTPQGEILTCNSTFLRMFGYSEEELLKQIKTELLYAQSDDRQAYLKKLTEDGGVTNYEVLFRRKNGALFWGLETSVCFADLTGRIIHVDGTIVDITDRKMAEDTMRFMATHDMLTKLPNRSLFDDRLEHAIEMAQRKNELLAVLFIDLDNFKTVNDALGHKSGDWLLQLVAQRLTGCVRTSDTVSRLSGDEFGIILEGFSKADYILPVIDKILRATEEPFFINSSEMFITSSIGVSVYPEDGTTSDVLVQNADQAMYWAKENGRNNYHFYSIEMKTQVLERLELKTQLRHVIKKQELVLHYQPIVDLCDGSILGAEVLMRWQHPELGLLPPARFIGLAEETGFITSMGEWMLREVCNQIQAWQAAGLKAVRVSINLSQRELKQPNLLETIQNVLHESGVNPAFLQMELSENILSKDFMKDIGILLEIKKLGISLALDDFGSGYSSLSRLALFPFDTIKLDRQFISNVDMEKDAAIATGIMTISNHLNMEIVAEGVETREQLSFFGDLGCNRIQGWYFSKALPVEELNGLLKQSNPFAGRAIPLK